MIYRFFKHGTNIQLEEMRDANWPLIREGCRIGVKIEGRETLCQVVQVGQPNLGPGNNLVVDVWVTDLFPAGSGNAATPS